MSTVAGGAAWAACGIATVGVVATADPKPAPPPWVVAFGTTLGKAASDEGIEANVVG
jgi:hypothetical protein